MANTPVYVTSIRAIPPLVVTGGTSPVIALTGGASTILTVPYGGTGVGTITGIIQGNGTSAFTAITNSSTVGQVLRVTGASTYAWGALNLADTDAVTGILPAANVAAPGATTQVIFNDAGALAGDSGFTFDKTTGSLTLSKAYAGGINVTVYNTSADAAALSEYYAQSNAGVIGHAVYSTAGGGAGLLYSTMTGGFKIYTTGATSLGLGTFSDATRVVIDSSGNTNIKGTTKLVGSSSGFVGLKGAAAAGSTTYTLPAADGTKSYGLATDGGAVLSWQDVGGRNVVMYGADPTGSADSLSAIQAAIDACGASGMVYFPPGTYKITNAIRAGSNIKLYGAGYASQISYAGTGGVTCDWVDGGGSGTLYFMVLNENGHKRNTDPVTDTNIEICHLRFTYTSGTSPHSILFMNTTGCKVHHCFQDGGAQSLCAFLKSSYYEVTDNYSNGNVNCAYDQWDGSSYGVVANNVAVVGNLGSGVFVNGVATDTTTPVNNDAHHIVVANNVIQANHAGCIQGIYLAGLNATSTVKHCTVVGNVITTASSDTLKFDVGIDVRQGGFNVVSGNVVSGAMDTANIEIQCNHNLINNNVIEGAVTAIEFSSADYNSITGNVIEGATTGLSLPSGSDYNQVSGNIFQGNTTDISDAGTGNQNTTNSSANTLNIVQ